MSSVSRILVCCGLLVSAACTGPVDAPLVSARKDFSEPPDASTQSTLEVTIAIGHNGDPAMGRQFADNQSCAFFLKILKNGGLEDAYAPYFQIWWASSESDSIAQYPHGINLPNLAPGTGQGEQINVFVTDTRDGSYDGDVADILVFDDGGQGWGITCYN